MQTPSEIRSPAAASASTHSSVNVAAAEPSFQKLPFFLRWALDRPVVRIVLPILGVMLLVSSWMVYVFFSTAYVTSIPVESMAWNSDSRLLALSIRAEKIVVLDCQKERPVVRHILDAGNDSNLIELAWSPDSNFLAGLSYSHTCIYSMATGGKVDRFEVSQSKDNVHGLAMWMPDNNLAMMDASKMTFRKYEPLSSGPAVATTTVPFPFPMPVPVEETYEGTNMTYMSGTTHLCLQPGRRKCLLVEQKKRGWPSTTIPQNNIYIQDLEKALGPRSIKITSPPVICSLSADGKALAMVSLPDADTDPVPVRIDVLDVDVSTEVTRSMAAPPELLRGYAVDRWGIHYTYRAERTHHALTWSSDGKRLAAAFYLNAQGYPYVTHVLMMWWNTESGALLAHQMITLPPRIQFSFMPGPLDRDFDNGSSPMCWSPDLSHLAISMEIKCTANAKNLFQLYAVKAIPAPPEAR
ncbi:MAG: hypothetical protein ACAI35_18825 [Candidatus Methylacidiphilales bacterium]